MIDYINRDKFDSDSTDKQLILTFSDGAVITNADIYSESLELKESICSEPNLRYGCCEASVLKVTIANTFVSRVGLKVTVKMVLDNDTAHPFTIGTYKVVTDKPTADRKKRELSCYDAMYDIINSDVAAWYNTILPNDNSVVTMKVFRDSFINHFGLEVVESDLPNDDMTVAKTLAVASISGKDVITAICEANGCFGHITRDNKFKFVELSTIILGLYPADDLYPDDDLFPKEDSGVTNIDSSLYTSANYEDFTTKNISKLVIRENENDVGTTVGDGDNLYIIQGNFLFFGKTSIALQNIGANLLDKIQWHWYRPCEIELKGNPCFEVGDGIRVKTSYEVIMAYILQRELKGIQALKDTFIADGTQEQPEVQTSLRSEVKQLKSVTHTIVNEVDELSSEINDSSTGLRTQIQQTQSQVSAKVDNTHTGTSFGWQLTDSGWRVFNDVVDIFTVNNSGASLRGSFTSEGSKYTTTINDGTITSNYILLGSTISGNWTLVTPTLISMNSGSNGVSFSAVTGNISCKTLNDDTVGNMKLTLEKSSSGTYSGGATIYEFTGKDGIAHTGVNAIPSCDYVQKYVQNYVASHMPSTTSEG